MSGEGRPKEISRTGTGETDSVSPGGFEERDRSAPRGSNRVRSALRRVFYVVVPSAFLACCTPAVGDSRNFSDDPFDAGQDGGKKVEEFSMPRITQILASTRDITVFGNAASWMRDGDEITVVVNVVDPSDGSLIEPHFGSVVVSGGRFSFFSQFENADDGDLALISADGGVDLEIVLRPPGQQMSAFPEIPSI